MTVEMISSSGAIARISRLSGRYIRPIIARPAARLTVHLRFRSSSSRWRSRSRGSSDSAADADPSSATGPDRATL